MRKLKEQEKLAKPEEQRRQTKLSAILTAGTNIVKQIEEQQKAAWTAESIEVKTRCFEKKSPSWRKSSLSPPRGPLVMDKETIALCVLPHSWPRMLIRLD